MHIKSLQAGTQGFQLLRAQFLPAFICRHLQRQMPVCRMAGADLRGQLDGQGANDGVARLHLGGVEVGNMAVKGRAVRLHPVQCTRVAADEPSDGFLVGFLLWTHVADCGRWGGRWGVWQACRQPRFMGQRFLAKRLRWF